MKKMIAVALTLAAAGAFAEPDMEKFNKSCAVCHNTGAANAPKVHDVDAWKPRLEKGMDALVQSVTNGPWSMVTISPTLRHTVTPITVLGPWSAVGGPLFVVSGKLFRNLSRFQSGFHK